MAVGGRAYPVETSSPVGGDGKVYLLGQRGHLAVVSTAGEWELLHQARFGEDVYATLRRWPAASTSAQAATRPRQP